jgi:acetyl-CoA C-acetyltransferase
MPGVKDKVAIIGMGCTKFDEHWDKDVMDLIIDACFEAFADAKVDPTKDIKAAWWSTMWNGELGRSLAYPLKLPIIPITRIENRCASGLDAMRNAYYAVASGAYDIVLVCGAEKLKDIGMASPGGDPSTPYTSRVEPVSFPVACFAQLAQRYFYKYGIPLAKGRETLSQIAVKNHHNGSLNPKAQFQKEITMDQAMNAPMISYPLGLFDACGVTDGAAAAVLCRADMAKSFRDDYILIKGEGMATGHFQTKTEDYQEGYNVEENVIASRTAFAEAGITNPRKQLDLAIVHDCFTITELAIIEDFGFSERGKGPEDIANGVFTLQGELPVNTDGGLKCFGHPIGASGIRMTYEVYKQLQGKADKRQVKIKNGLGLAHSLGGTPIDGGTGAISIFGTRD